MKNIFNKYKYQILLTVIVGVLFWVNYKPGTYLTGWDNLQTELNPWLAVKRAFFSVWEEYQSFGLTAGMAHAADLPRTIFLWIMSFVIPQNMIRYFYHFLMLLLGGLGMFKVIIGLVPTQSGEANNNEMTAFLGSLFYMLNLGTVQIFYLPYEAFSTFFALLPWGIWIFIKLLKSNFSLVPTQSGDNKERQKNIKLFFLINLLGTPAFYTQQIFIVYILVLSCILLGFIYETAVYKINIIKKGLTLVGLILVINSFWLLPQLYFLNTNGKVVTEAKNNTLSTENVFYQNFEKGNLSNFLRLEGFYFDLKGRDNTFLFEPWKDHFKNPIFGVLPYIFGLIGLIGLVAQIRKNKNLRMVFILILCGVGLLLDTPPFSWINEFFRQFPIINQIFRSPFTKFIIPYSLVYSYFIAKGINYIDSRFHGNDIPKRLILNTFYLILTFSILVYSLPSFQGYFFSPEMKVNIPPDYHSVIDYFKTEGKNSRIALLPDYTFWGWFFNKWGYNGSGFIWYGIEQPIVSRTFDVWSKASESYFWESKSAFEAEDIRKLISVFEKYQINYLLLDKSLIPIVSSYKALQYDRINDLLLQNSQITQIFSSENISLYKIDHQNISKNYISISSDLKNISPNIDVTNDDQAFTENSTYVNNQSNDPDIFYPFLSLTSQVADSDRDWQISEDDGFFYLTTTINLDINRYQLFLKNNYSQNVIINQEPLETSIQIQPFIQGNKLIIKFDKKLIENFDVSSTNRESEFGFTDNNLSQNISYIIKTKSINTSGQPLSFYIVDETKKQSYLETRLSKSPEYFIIQPRFMSGLGYTFAFQNKSFINLSSTNKLEELSVYIFPYQNLKDMKFIKKGSNNIGTNFSNDFEAEKINYFTYKISINYPLQPTPYNLVLFQSYSPGWIAFSNGKLLEHFKINNWANAWRLDNELTANHQSLVTVVFWPQYLEFLGFGLLVLSFLFILKFSSEDP